LEVILVDWRNFRFDRWFAFGCVPSTDQCVVGADEITSHRDDKMTYATSLLSVSSDRLASVLGYGVSANLLDQLIGTPRFRDRVVGLVELYLGDVGVLGREQMKILAMQPDDLIDLANRAGSVWHAGSIARAIDAESRRLLVSLLGTKNYDLALASINLQPPGLALDVVPEDVAKAVPIDGAACVAAWCERQASAVSTRLRLVRPVASPELSHETWGPQIIARLLAD
jgi:hypothetical protein